MDTRPLFPPPTWPGYEAKIDQTPCGYVIYWIPIQWIPVALEKYGIRIPSRKYHSTGYVQGAIIVCRFQLSPNRMRPYDRDLRWRIVFQRIGMGLQYDKIAQNLNVSTSTAYRIFSRFDATGDQLSINIDRIYNAWISKVSCMLWAWSWKTPLSILQRYARIESCTLFLLPPQ